ncbi:hypothetical protein ACYZT9_04085 [Pseudomonas sp. ZT5P21]
MDYRRIRGKDSGQRLAFEELVCQLARREPPAADAEFRRIEGAGGDGGIRDSALGIIELAQFKNCLPATVDIHKARPPYTSKVIRLSVTEEALDRIAKRACDSQIKVSCTGWGGDFASYEIQPRVSSFLKISLTSPEPLTISEKYELFEQEVIDHCPVRAQLLKLMHSFSYNPFRNIRDRHKDKEPTDNSEDFKECEKLLLEMLSDDEKTRYTKEYKERFVFSMSSPGQLPHIDIKAAQRWIAKRAYVLGWTKKLFPDDRSRRHDYSRDRPLVERIGKKYQWLALDELLCSLADNKWMSERAPHGSRQYAGPLDIGFHRDIDPTILLTDETGGASPQEFLIEKFEICMRETTEDEVGKWPFEEDPTTRMADLLCRSGSSEGKWVVMHEHRSLSERYDDKANREHGLRKQEWRFLLPVIVRTEDEQLLLEYIQKQESINVDSWTTRDSTDNGFLKEAPWRSTWDQEQWLSQYFHDLGEIEIAYPCFRYQWESHLDASLSEGAHSLMPAPWLAHRLDLKPHSEDPNLYVDGTGNTRFVSGRSPSDGSHAYIDQELFESFLKQDELACVWVFVAERGAWPGGENENASRRRSEGVIWHERGKPKMACWNDDWGRGNSKRYVSAKV